MIESADLEPCAIIPARFESSRFPGKPLELVGKTPMVIRVALNAAEALGSSNVWVATNHKRIQKTCDDYNVNCVITGDHKTGTDRVFEAASLLGRKLLINIQGDEPLVDAFDIRTISERLVANPETIHLGGFTAGEEDMLAASVPKMVLDMDNNLIYASRAPIPAKKEGGLPQTGVKQVAVYGFSFENLRVFSSTERGPLEKSEDIEILRFVENALAVVKVHMFSQNSIPVDYPHDLNRVNTLISGDQQ